MICLSWVSAEAAQQARPLALGLDARPLDRLALGAQERGRVDRVEQLAQRGARLEHRGAREDREPAEALESTSERHAPSDSARKSSTALSTPLAGVPSSSAFSRSSFSPAPSSVCPGTIPRRACGWRWASGIACGSE